MPAAPTAQPTLRPHPLPHTPAKGFLLPAAGARSPPPGYLGRGCLQWRFTLKLLPSQSPPGWRGPAPWARGNHSAGGLAPFSRATGWQATELPSARASTETPPPASARWTPPRSIPLPVVGVGTPPAPPAPTARLKATAHGDTQGCAQPRGLGSSQDAWARGGGGGSIWGQDTRLSSLPCPPQAGHLLANAWAHPCGRVCRSPG